MKLLLKEFQTDAVARLVKRLRDAAADVRSGDMQSISLSSPTGSGKTVMVTAAIELLLQGDDSYAPRADTTFLWVTDQPELNEQTRRKMLEASSLLGPSTLVMIDASFDRELFAPGVVYFLNTQKLGRDKSLVTHGDNRTFTIWESIANTVRDRPGAFYVLIDEAHRGMTENRRAQNEATTIIQKFIKGSPGEIPRVPLITGISATPERFDALIAETERTRRPVTVKADDVRASGLLKETIVLYHPRDDQPADITLLRAAAQSWRLYRDRWAKYCAAQDEKMVEPIMVVQVQDAPSTGHQPSKTNIAAAMSVIESEIGPLPAVAFAHAFQEGARLSLDGHELRYLSPSEIHYDPAIRVVFFKTSLNTGWDCPRAEVMVSFRTAVDATYIAQLVGRMVRTPLARRIDADEHLNTVALYLPHYDERGLNRVITQLTSPDHEILAPIAVEKGEDLVTLQRASGLDTAFELLAQLPSYIIPRSRKTSEMRRLMKFGRLLANDQIEADGPEKATDTLLEVLRAEYDKAKNTERFKQIIERKGKVTIQAVAWRVGDMEASDADVLELDMASENIEDLFETAGRKLGEGLHKAWWKSRASSDPVTRTTAKLELFALSLDPTVARQLETTAQATVQRWFKDHGEAIAALGDTRQQEYGEIRRLAVTPELAPLTYPTTIDVKRADKTWAKHLYVESTGAFPAAFNKWETRVLEEEVARPDVVAWLRNPDRKPWSFCVPYDLGGEDRALYPDFLVVRSVNGHLVVDILDPHSIELADAPAKAAGLARYAAQHWPRFGRIELIIVDGDNTRRLDLTDETIRDKVKGVTSHGELQRLFSS